MNNLLLNDTICAVATGGSKSAIAIIRISGDDAINYTNNIFSKNIINKNSHTIHFGTIFDKNVIIDEVLVSIFKDTRSYTGENTIEISCHGSIYIQQKILELLVHNGCRIASPGEFTLRAFKNGKLDLSQAESVGDLIESKSQASHQIAVNHLRGGFKDQLSTLRKELINFASLIELELDFSEEDVEFANRDDLILLLNKINIKLEKLISSFKLGNVIKNGISVSILGAPNVGKSTLLNLLVNEEKSIVSNIPGTTRDTIEDYVNILGYMFRFVDTAGIRRTDNTIEKLGIERSFDSAKKSEIIIYVIDPILNIDKQLNELKNIKNIITGQLIIAINKIDINPSISYKLNNSIYISAKNNIGIDKLKDQLIDIVKNLEISNNDTIISNVRHYEELKLTLSEIKFVVNGIKSNISSDFLSVNIKQALYHLGNITGEITTDTLLGNIFSKFCIGK